MSHPTSVKRFTGFCVLAPAVLILAMALMLSSATAGDKVHEFVGAKKCKMCHIKQFRSWKTTRMASAFEVLKPAAAAEAKKANGLDPDKDFTSDEDCLGCHTTGYGKPGGFVSVEETPDLVGVGCESCHGPGSEYLKPGLMTNKNKEHTFESVRQAGLVYPPTQETCQSQCHNEKSPFVPKD